MRILTLCLGLLLLAAPAFARENLEHRADVKKALAVLEQGNYVKARELAEEIVKKEPYNYVACFILGRVYLWAEGSLPRAYFYLTRCRKSLEARWGTPVDSEGPWRTHAMMLQDLADACGQMEDYRKELEIREEYDRLYVPKQPHEHGWPLMKMGKLDQARQRMQAVLAESKEESERVTALNTLGAIEFEARNVKQGHEYYQQLVDEIRRNGWSMEDTFLRNLAETEHQLGNYPRAEELLLEASRYENAYSYTNPWADLVLLYLPQGRFPELLSVARKMQARAANSSPVVVNQSWAERQLLTAMVLLGIGYDDAAETLLRRVVYRPDRNMSTSNKAYISQVMTLGVFRQILICRRERLREEMSWSTWKQYFADMARLVALGHELDSITEKAAAEVVRHDGLFWAVQTHQTGSVFPTWYAGDLNNVFGTGVVAAEIKRVRKNGHSNYEVEKPYLTAILAEGAYLRVGMLGGRAQAEEMLKKALEEVPPAQVLLRARLEAMLGDILWRKGQYEEALGHFSTAFETDAGVFRRLRLRLPASISSSGGALASRAAGYLRNSPRFFSHPKGFKVVVSEGTGLSATVSDHRGTRVASLSSPAKKDADETVRAFCARFHEFVFSARMDLSQMDINNLNGSNAASNLAREQLMKSLDMKPGKPR